VPRSPILNLINTVHAFLLFYKIHFNPLNAELNPICHFLALVGAHHILHVSRIRVKITLPSMSRSFKRSVNFTFSHYIPLWIFFFSHVWHIFLYLIFSKTHEGFASNPKIPWQRSHFYLTAAATCELAEVWSIFHSFGYSRNMSTVGRTGITVSTLKICTIPINYLLREWLSFKKKFIEFKIFLLFPYGAISMYHTQEPGRTATATFSRHGRSTVMY
jgi:hypothetical protein